MNVALTVIGANPPSPGQRFAGIDVSDVKLPQQKAARLRGVGSEKLLTLDQHAQLKNPDECILTVELPSVGRLSDYADSYHGISTTDYAQFGRLFWELRELGVCWIPQQSTVDDTSLFAGREHALWWGNDGDRLRELQNLGVPIVITGLEAWGRDGIAVSQMSDLPVTRYCGGSFDDNTGVSSLRRANTWHRFGRFAVPGVCPLASSDRPFDQGHIPDAC